MTAEISQAATRSAGVNGSLRGCDLSLTHMAHPNNEGHTWLQLDREAHSYSRTLTDAELAGLARLNPDDGPTTHKLVLGLLADLTLALETLGGAWESMIAYHPRTGLFIPNALITPPSGDELTTLGRLASELIAAIGVS